MNKIKKIFNTENPVIGMVHFMPLLGYEDFTNMNIVLRKALEDVKVLENGGVDGLMLENNYDFPHKIKVNPETISCMTYLTQKIIEKTKLPVGVCVLWNDYKAALSIAKVCGGKFVRVPVFVDRVKTHYGIVTGDPAEVIAYREKIEAENILLLTDIHVKHAVLLNRDTIDKSALKAINKGSDGIIITGKWTADAPVIEDLKKVRKAAHKFPIFVGSGATVENIESLLQFANGIIVGTTLKTGRKETGNVNIKGYNEKIDINKVKDFTNRVRNILNL